MSEVNFKLRQAVAELDEFRGYDSEDREAARQRVLVKRKARADAQAQLDEELALVERIKRKLGSG